MVISFALSSTLRNRTCTLAPHRRTHSAHSSYTLLSRRVRKKRETGRKTEKKTVRFWRSGITCEEGDEQGGGGDGKPEAQLRPSFSAALPIYILRRIYRRMCMFLISWMHKPRARARIDAPMHLARRTFSDARIAILFLNPLYPPFSVFSSHVLVHHLAFPLISTQIRDLLFAFLSLSLFFVFFFRPSISFLPVVTGLCFSSRVFNIFHIFSAKFLLSSLAHFVIL